MNLVDTLICQLDAGLRTVFAVTPAARAMPKVNAEASAMATSDAVTSIRLMRVNHVGEVSAQALYQGQLLVARDSATREILEHAALEERDHLAWCQSRINELGGQTSLLSPVFYAGAWAMGVMSGLVGDKWSMGFLVETERQVEAHLDTHLEKLPVNDMKSRAIIAQMRQDEIEHGNTGEAHGAAALPSPIKAMMRASSKVMTSTTYWV